MKKTFPILFFSLILFQISAQKFYTLDVPAYENGEVLTNPWAGGMNAPQWSSFDINNDGAKDLYAFDRHGNVHMSFINMNSSPGATEYKFSRYWLNNFPTVQNYVLMRDYNRDGVADMFASAFDELLSGFKVYKGNFQNGHLFFDRIEFPEYDYDIIPFQVNGQVVDLIEVYNNPDYPAIDDIDGDGDLDILTMNSSASKILYFKNIALESGFNDEVLLFEFNNDCWGRIGITPFSQKFTLSSDADVCPFFRDPSDAENRVHGGTTLCTLDKDNDGDKELLYGDLIYPTIIFGENGGTKDHAWINSQDTMFSSSDISVDIPDYPASFHLDVNNDGARDLLFSPNQPLGTPDINTVWWYENEGTDQNPDFKFKQRDFIAETMLDFGTGAHPVFADIDADGLLDIVIGNRFEWDSVLDNSYLVLLLNIGTATEPIYDVVDRDWLGLQQYDSETWSFAPAFGDIDDDGDEDLLIGDRQGFIHFLQNTAGAGMPMQFAAPVFEWMEINIGAYATPFIHDINKDGLMDLLIGERNGNVNYFPNIGTIGNPAFHPNEGEAPNNDFFGLINTHFNGSTVGFSQPVVLEFSDASYVVTGSDAGWLKQYKINPDSLMSGAFELRDSQLGAWREGFVSRIAFANINESEYLDAIIGNDRGGVSLFQSPITVDGLVNDNEAVLLDEKEITIYPNPVSQSLFIKMENMDISNEFDFKIINSIGQIILMGEKQYNNEIDIHSISNGMYFLQIKLKGKIINKRFVKQ